MVFEVRAEDKELTFYQRKFSMKEILARLNAGGECVMIRDWCMHAPKPYYGGTMVLRMDGDI